MSKIRIEYVRLRRGGDEGDFEPNVIVGRAGQAVEVTAAPASAVVATVPALTTDRQYQGGVFARFVALSGSAIVLVGGDSAVTLANGTLVTPAQPVLLPVEAGQNIRALQPLFGGPVVLTAGETVSGFPGGLYVLSLSATSWNGGSGKVSAQHPADPAQSLDVVPAKTANFISEMRVAENAALTLVVTGAPVGLACSLALASR